MYKHTHHKVREKHQLKIQAGVNMFMFMMMHLLKNANMVVLGVYPSKVVTCMVAHTVVIS